MSRRSSRTKRNTTQFTFEDDDDETSRPAPKKVAKIDFNKSSHSWICSFEAFSQLACGTGQSTFSSSFMIGNHEFKLYICPGGNKEESKGYVSIFLQLCKPSRAEFKFALSICMDGKEYFEKCANHKFDLDKKSSKFGWPQFIKRSVLLDQVIRFTRDELKVMIKIFDLDVSEYSHQLNKLRSLEKLINDEQFSDVKIIVGGKTIHAHKVILTNNNIVFASLLKNNSPGCKESVINVEDIEFEVMLELIRFIYIGEFRNLPTMAKKLLAAAKKYDIELLKHKCSEYLCQEITPDNFLEIFSIADTNKEDVLTKRAVAFFKDHKQDIIKDPQFKASLEKMGMDIVVKLTAVLIDV